ncbi:acyltransferase family protein [Phormidesmis priestleyi]
MNPSSRRYDLDWLRVLAVLLLVYFHAAAVFYRGELGEFYIQNNPSSPALTAFIFFVHQWHMPLFFLLSGSATWFSLQGRSPRQYLRDRFKRLFVPFVFGTLVLVPPQVYYKLLSHDQFQGSYLQFYPQFFNGIRPNGNFEWAHLWFVIYLLVLSIVALPFLLFLKRKQSDFSNWISILEKPGAIFLPAIPLAVIEGILRPHWFGFQNLYDDWANVLLYLTYLIYGFVLSSDDRLEKAIARHQISSLSLAIIGTFILFSLSISNTLPERSYSLGYVLYQMFRGLHSWCWVIALLALGQGYLCFNNRLLAYLNQASYPIFLLHQSVLVAISFYVIQWNVGILEKFLIISTASIVTTIVLYDLIIKRLNWIRFLFGLKHQ